MKALPKPSGEIDIKEIRQIISDADLRLALRLVRQQRRIEELKRICGIR